jgi:hypothetical protein
MELSEEAQKGFESENKTKKRVTQNMLLLPIASCA